VAGDVRPRPATGAVGNDTLVWPALDRYLEKLIGVDLTDGPAMSTDDYVAALEKGPGWPGANRASPGNAGP